MIMPITARTATPINKAIKMLPKASPIPSELANQAKPRPAAKPPKLLDQVRDRIRVLHYSRSTEATYTYWIKFYIHFHAAQWGMFANALVFTAIYARGLVNHWSPTHDAL